jgi:hypothetical protein
MKSEEIQERMDDTESVLAQQGKRIIELEKKEIKFPEIHIPDYSKEFEELKSHITRVLKQSDKSELEELKAHISEVLKQPDSIGFIAETIGRLERLDGLAKQLPELVIPVRHHHHFENKSKWWLTAGIVLLLITSIASELCYSLYRENHRLHDNDVKFRMIRQRYPIATRWADSTFYRDPKEVEKVTEKLEAQDLAVAEAEAIARQKQQEAKEAKSAVSKLKRQ